MTRSIECLGAIEHIAVFLPLRIWRRWRGNRVCVIALVASSAVLLTTVARAANGTWTGTSGVNGNWSTASNWLTTQPDSTGTVIFDSNSTGTVTTNNDLLTALKGITLANVPGTVGSNPVSISGNALSLGAGGINFAGTSDTPGPATQDLAIGANLSLSAAQNWKLGGNNDVTLTIGTSSANTVDLNGNALTLQHVGTAQHMIINSSIHDGSSAGSLVFKASAGSSQTQFRLLGTNTFSGGASTYGSKQVIQLGSSTVKSGSTIVSGPLGTGGITINPASPSNGGITYLEAYGGNRTLDNDIEMVHTASLYVTTSVGEANHSLTLNGTVTLDQNATILTDSASSGGSGDLIFNGNVMLTGASGTKLTTGESPSAVAHPGKVIYNGNILQTAGNYTLIVTNGTNTYPVTVQLNGQNTFDGGVTLSAGGAATSGDYNRDDQVDAADYVIWRKDPTSHGGDPGYNTWRSNFGNTYTAGIQLGSSSILDGGGNILSGPLGTGTLTFQNGGNTAQIEAVHGPQTVANKITFNGSVATDGIVQGSDNLTLTGQIFSSSGGGEKLHKEGTGTLTLTNDNNNFTGGVEVNGGTVLAANPNSFGSATGTGAVTVNSFGTLGGSGYVAGAVTVNGGALSPGASIGTLTLQSSLALADASRLNFELASAGSHDLINVGGALTLPNSGSTVTLNLANAGGMGAGTYTLIDYAGA